MNADAVFRRTAAGQQALDTRDKRLGSRMRALMLMAEGKPLSQFSTMAEALGAPPDALTQLIDEGFAEAVATVPASPVAEAVPEDPFQRFRMASGLIRELATDVLGLKSFFFMLKVEKCATVADLAPLVPELVQAVGKKRGAAAAREVEARLRALTG